MNTGVDAFIAGLKELGYLPETLLDKADHVVIDYTVESGKFQGRKVRLGFIVPPDFPVTAPGGPHVNPRIHPLNPNGPHPAGHVHASDVFQTALGGEWQYWSRPFSDWGKTKKLVATYLSHVWKLWDSQ